MLKNKYEKELKRPIDEIFIYKIMGVNLVMNLLFGIVGGFTCETMVMTPYIYYISTGVMFYHIHKLAHITINDKWKKSKNIIVKQVLKLVDEWRRVHYLNHHKKSYPPTKFLNSKYQFEDDDPYYLNTNMYLIPALIFGAFVSWINQYNYLQIFVMTGIIVFNLWLEDYVHRHLHDKNSVLNEYVWFQKLRYLHFLHHYQTMKHNYAIKDFWFDLLTNQLLIIE